MTDLRQAAQQAIAALIDAANVLSAPMFADAVDALKAALEQQERKPLTEEEMANIWDDALTSTGPPFFIRIIRAVERAHNIKEQP